MKKILLGGLIWMAVGSAYANCNGRILHAGGGKICMLPASDYIASSRLCTRVDGTKYCASLNEGNVGRVHVRLNGSVYSVPDFMESVVAVRFDGASYIDLGFVPTTDLQFEIRADLDESESYRDGALLGTQSYILWYNTLFGYSVVSPRFFGEINNIIPVSDDAITLRWENEIFTINGEVYDIEYFVTPMNQGTVNLALGGIMAVGSLRFLGDIYSAKFWDSNGVIMDMVAATDADGVPGMFDKISGRMLYLKQ